MGEKILVTGGQGFLGSWIVKLLLTQGTTPVVFDLNQQDTILEQVLTGDELANLERHYGKSNLVLQPCSCSVGNITDAASFKELVCTIKPKSIIHLAGLQIPTCRANPILGASVNVLGTLSVFEAVKAFAEQTAEPPISVVYASSAAVLGPKEDYPKADVPLPDEYHHAPATIYGVYKLCNEGCARIYWKDHKIPSVGLRPLTCFGVGRELGLTSGPTKAIKSAVLGRKYVCAMAGTSGFSSSVDMARIFVGCARATVAGSPVFNIRGEVTSIDTFMQAVFAILPEAKDLITVEGTEVPIMADVSEEKLIQLLRTVPEPYNLPAQFPTPLESSIKEIVDHFKLLQSEGRLHDKDL